MASIDRTYKKALEEILNEGYEYEDPNRKGVYRRELLSLSLRHSLSDGFPALTTKEVYFKGALNELLFFLSGSTDIRDLWKKGVHFWDKDWANFHGYTQDEISLADQMQFDPKVDSKIYDMGRIYPAQYRSWHKVENFPENKKVYVDQIETVLSKLRKNPLDTSMVVTAWNPAELEDMCLPPCHYGFQIVGRPLTIKERSEIFYTKHDNLDDFAPKGMEVQGMFHQVKVRLDNAEIAKYGFEIHWQQRSTDFFLGTPINIMYYALMACLFEKMTGHVALAVHPDLKKVHLYDNQWEVAKEQIKKDVSLYSNSYVEFANNVTYNGSIDDFLESYIDGDIQLKGYDSYSKLKVPMLPYDKK